MPTPRAFRDLVTQRVHEILAQTHERFDGISEHVAAFFSPAFELTHGGKRMRATLMATGYAAAGGTNECSPAAIELGAALELFQAAALIHDDIIDDSDTRRGRPSTFALFAAAAPPDSLESPEVFGKNAAILLGDLLIVLADQSARRAFGRAGAGAQNRCHGLWDEMTSEVAIGQYLDTLNSTLAPSTLTPAEALQAALRVVAHKSARYSVEHPLTLGAALAGGSDDLIANLARVGLPLGEAFQLRDDDLGVFGDPQTTGKPAGDDLREGKRTALLALTRMLASPADARDVDRHVGDRTMSAETVNALRAIIQGCGARREHEKLINERLTVALAAIEGANLSDSVARTLCDHAQRLTHRDS